MPASILEVAARARVSPATVSRVLGDKAAQVAGPTRERVERAARELEYHPSAAARALVRRQTDTVGVVFPPTDVSPLRNPFFSALLGGVLEAATERHRNVMVFTAATGQDARGNRTLGPLRDGRCDGLIVFYQPPHDDILPALLDARVPCTLVSDWRDDPRLPCVDVENEAATLRLTEHLLGLGHRRIALLAGETINRYTTLRIAGYRRAMRADSDSAYGVGAATGERVEVGLVPWNAPGVFARVEALMALPVGERPTALLCLSDELAAIGVAALARMGLRVPEDVSVTGFNDDAHATRQHPALTTVRQPYLRLGEWAIDSLLERIANGPEAAARKVLLPTELVIRESTAPPPERV